MDVAFAVPPRLFGAPDLLGLDASVARRFFGGTALLGGGFGGVLRFLFLAMVRRNKGTKQYLAGRRWETERMVKQDKIARTKRGSQDATFGRINYSIRGSAHAKSLHKGFNTQNNGYKKIGLAEAAKAIHKGFNTKIMVTKR